MRKKIHLEDKRLNLKEGSIPSLFPSKKDIDAGSETLSSAYEWPSKSRMKDRDPTLKAMGVVYEISCSCGPKYIGETKRALGTRLKEHQAATRRGETEKSAITEHALSRHHQPLWEQTRILDRASHTTTLLIKEIIHISLRDPAELLNKDQVALTLIAAGRILPDDH